MSILEELKWRGLLYDASEGVAERLAKGPTTLYIGFDPTASSLHVGSLLQILGLARMQRYGHRPIALVGGGTGMIGDPSGKSHERQLLTADKVQENLVGLREQLGRFLDFGDGDGSTSDGGSGSDAALVDNGDWLMKTNLVEFLRDIGKHFTINYMMAKDSVKTRIDKEEGLSFTEFSYMLLQSYDFLVLHDSHGCELQMGGSDQWGNITAGAELVRKLRRKKAYGIVQPLVTTSSGVKFGKTESGTIWLDAERTSPYRFYQFWLNTSDADVVRYLKYFTWLTQDQISELATTHGETPQAREAHRKLASEVTAMVHGADALERAVRSSEILFGAEISDLPVAEILDVFDDVPSSHQPKEGFEGDGKALVEALVDAGLAASKGAAKRLVRDGGAYVNNRRITDERARLTSQDLLHGHLLVLRAGQKKYHLMNLAEGA